MENAEAMLERREKPHMTILNEALETMHLQNKTHREWEMFAFKTLHNNDILPQQFSSCIKGLVLKGQGKY